MATHVSPQKINELAKRADAAMAKLQKMRGKTEEKVGEAFKLVETVGAGVLVGVARAKWGEVTVGPDVPLDALVGGAMSLAAFIDLPGRFSEHIHNLGNGILTGAGTLEAVKLTGGVVLSKDEYERLLTGATVERPVEKTAVQGEPRALPASNGRSAREILVPAHGEQAEHIEQKRSS